MQIELTQRPALATTGRVSWSLSLPVRLLIDALLIALGFWLAYFLRYQQELGGVLETADRRPFRDFLPVIGGLAALFLAIAWARGLYRLSRWSGLLDETRIILHSAVAAFGAVIIVAFYSRQFYFSRLVFLYALVFVVVHLILGRFIMRAVRSWLRSRQRCRDRIIVLGTGPAGERVLSALIEQPKPGIEVIGVIDDAPPAAGWAIPTQRMLARPRYLGACADLPAVLSEHAADEVILALPPTAHDRLLDAIEQCRAARVPFTILPDLFELSLDGFEIHQLRGLPLLTLRNAGIHGWNAVLKRAFDIAVTLAALAVCAVPLLVIALLIRIDSPGPILYRQRRVGRGGVPFTFYKFRSMCQDADRRREQLARGDRYDGDPIMFKLRDDPRCTRVGRWLRRTSLDEFPNLLNVLRGEMSIVGPRPHLPEEVAHYEPWQRRRLETPPGITCLWQINGRSHLGFAEQARLDIYYAERWSLWLDITILLRTIPAVLTARGAY